MNSRERWLAALRLQEIDRLPFWPKLEASYPPAQVEPFSRMSIREIHDWIGSDNHYWLPSSVQEVRKRTDFVIEDSGNTRRITYQTNVGNTQTVLKYDKISHSWHPVEMPIKVKNDIYIMQEWFNDCQYAVDQENIEKGKIIRNTLGDRGITAENIGESPLMYFIEWLAGIENAHYLLIDYPQDVEGLFKTIHGNLLKKTKLVTENSIADILYFTENTSTTLISPQQYRDYCLSYINQYGEIINNEEKFFVLHMCGHLKQLLPDLTTTVASAFEAFTSPPVGNTTLYDGKKNCPDKCLIGGTNATLWLCSPQEIIHQIQGDLEKLHNHRGIVVTSAGVMPPYCKPETVKEVCNWVKDYKITR